MSTYYNAGFPPRSLAVGIRDVWPQIPVGRNYVEHFSGLVSKLNFVETAFGIPLTTWHYPGDPVSIQPLHMVVNHHALGVVNLTSAVDFMRSVAGVPPFPWHTAQGPWNTGQWLTGASLGHLLEITQAIGRMKDDYITPSGSVGVSYTRETTHGEEAPVVTTGEGFSGLDTGFRFRSSSQRSVTASFTRVTNPYRFSDRLIESVSLVAPGYDYESEDGSGLEDIEAENPESWVLINVSARALSAVVNRSFVRTVASYLYQAPWSLPTPQPNPISDDHEYYSNEEGQVGTLSFRLVQSAKFPENYDEMVAQANGSQSGPCRWFWSDLMPAVHAGEIFPFKPAEESIPGDSFAVYEQGKGYVDNLAEIGIDGLRPFAFGGTASSSFTHTVQDDGVIDPGGGEWLCWLEPVLEYPT